MVGDETLPPNLGGHDLLLPPRRELPPPDVVTLFPVCRRGARGYYRVRLPAEYRHQHCCDLNTCLLR